MKLAKFFAFGAVALALGLAPAVAQSRKDPRLTNIEQRQAFFKLVGLYYGPMRTTDRGDAEYNAEAISAAAANLALLVQLDQSKLWVPGADRSFSEVSATLPKASEEPEAVAKLRNDLALAVAALVPEAGKGLEAFKAAYKPVADSCAACHDTYRYSEN
ncbi:MAG: cytochrome c [Rhodobacteraceae bacterium]|nr:cytochrome c [Paracoccaceae bacterium]